VTGPAPISPAAARALADLLTYPSPGLADRARAAAAGLPPSVACPALRCADALAALGQGASEELYTATFDLRPAVSPYLGLHLCGEGPRRNALLAYLAGAYAEAGHAAGPELPDHVAEVLGFLANAGGSDLARELAAEALRPAALRMLAALPAENPYRGALEALLDALGADRTGEVPP
jgi:nitrate reductase molybdenum cofactor assembly chaperone NarJ/NarW